MKNAGLDEAQAGIKIAGKNINNLRYAEDTTLMAESEVELKNFLMKVKEENEKVGLKLNIQQTKIMPSGAVSSVQSLSHVRLLATPWTAARQNLLSFTSSWSLLKLVSIESVIPSNCFNSLLSPSPAFNLSQHQGLFQGVSSSHQVAKVLELQYQSF